VVLSVEIPVAELKNVNRCVSTTVRGTIGLQEDVAVAVQLLGQVLRLTVPANLAIEYDLLQIVAEAEQREGAGVHGFVRAATAAPAPDHDLRDSSAVSAYCGKEGMQSIRILDNERLLVQVAERFRVDLLVDGKQSGDELIGLILTVALLGLLREERRTSSTAPAATPIVKRAVIVGNRAAYDGATILPGFRHEGDGFVGQG